MGVVKRGCTQGCPLCRAYRNRTVTLYLRNCRGRSIFMCHACSKLSKAQLEHVRRRLERRKFNPLSFLKGLQK